MDKKFRVEVTVPEGLSAGDKFVMEVEIPAPEKKPRGVLAGLTLDQMTDEQLRREIINAASVLYKAKQRNADEKIIAANELRLAAARAEKERRAPTATIPTLVGVEVPNIAGALADEIESDTEI
jgi:hypothetical protein